MSTPEQDAPQLPILDIHTPAELQQLALQATLVKNKITDNPVQFLQENTVKSTGTFRLGVGMAVAITEITPNPVKPKS